MLPALLLTAGLGTRLRPLSAVRAKPAVPVAGESLVRRIVGWLAGSGVSDVVLNLHHLPETICAEVGDGSDLGVTARYSWENPILGSAGGPRRASALLGSDRFLVVNGDTLTDLDLATFLRGHDGARALVTMAVVPNRDAAHYGGVLVDGQGAVTGFVGRGSRTPSYHFIGVQVAEAAAFETLADGEAAESLGGLYPALIERRPGSVRAAVVDASFMDIGTPADYLSTSLGLAGAAGAGAVSLPSPLVGLRATVSPTAHLDRTILWDDVEVGDDVSLTECVVADGVRVPRGSCWQRRVVVPAGCCEPGPGDERAGDLLLSPVDRSRL